MKVQSILARKGTFVATIPGDASVTQLCELLTKHNIGAVVVSPDGTTVTGIVSERDIVRAVATHGPDIFSRDVSDFMTEVVAVCEPANTSDDLMVTMTARRVRHVPVVEDDSLTGIVSIGDVVRVALEELQEEKATLLGYITS